MPTTTFIIRGVHYAANPETYAGKPETNQELANTRTMLQWIEHDRPAVVLMNDPGNPRNPDAVMARTMGKRIGFICDEKVQQANDLLAESKLHKLMARVVAVDADVKPKQHGHVVIEVDADTPTKHVPTMASNINWDYWLRNQTLLPPNEDAMAQEEAEFMLSTMLNQMDTANLSHLKTYIDIWLKSSRHDLSREAREMRTTYIDRLEAAAKPEIRELAIGLKRQRASICGNFELGGHSGEWFKSQLESQPLQALWRGWRLENEAQLWAMLRQIDKKMRLLPGDLYNDVGDVGAMLSRLYYMKTPRRALQPILALLMLRHLTCNELGIEMQPMTEQDYGCDSLITNLPEIPTTLGRMMDYVKISNLTSTELNAIKLCILWLRDDYLNNVSTDIVQLADKTDRLNLNLEKQAAKGGIHIDTNHGPIVDVDKGELKLNRLLE